MSKNPKQILTIQKWRKMKEIEGNEYVLTYKGKQLSNNQMKSLHWRKLKKIVDPMKLEMFAIIRNAKLPEFNKIELLANYNSRLDVDNPSATVKIFVDQLVKANRLPDDNKKHWAKMTIQYKSELPHNTIEFIIKAA